MPEISTTAMSHPPSNLKDRLRCVAEAYSHAIVAVHQADGDRQIDKLLLIEDLARCVICVVRNTCLRYEGDGFGPSQRSTFGITEEASAFLPSLDQGQLLDLDAS